MFEHFSSLLKWFDGVTSPYCHSMTEYNNIYTVIAIMLGYIFIRIKLLYS